MKTICNFCLAYNECEYSSDDYNNPSICLVNYHWGTSPDDDKQWYAFVRDFTNLATVYCGYMAGEYNSERLRQLYSSSDSFRDAVEEARENHSYFIEDMGLIINNEKAGI